MPANDENRNVKGKENAKRFGENDPYTRKTVVVSALCLGSKVRVEAACALDGEETAAAAAKARLMCLPYGRAILSMDDFALSDDGDTNNARLAHALLCCCSAVMGADSAAKGGKIHGKEKGK